MTGDTEQKAWKIWSRKNAVYKTEGIFNEAVWQKQQSNACA